MNDTHERIIPLQCQIRTLNQRVDQLQRKADLEHRLKSLSDMLFKEELYRCFEEKEPMPHERLTLHGITENWSNKYYDNDAADRGFHHILEWTIEVQDYKEHNFKVHATAHELTHWLKVDSLKTYDNGKRVSFEFEFTF